MDKMLAHAQVLAKQVLHVRAYIYLKNDEKALPDVVRLKNELENIRQSVSDIENELRRLIYELDEAAEEYWRRR